MTNSQHIPAPTVDDMVAAGMPLWAAFEMWQQIICDKDGTDWWAAIRAWDGFPQSARRLQ